MGMALALQESDIGSIPGIPVGPQYYLEWLQSADLGITSEHGQVWHKTKTKIYERFNNVVPKYDF